MHSSNTDDASLIRLIAATQTDALGELYERYHRLVFSVALAILGDRSTAEEVTLDVFVRVWRGAGGYRPELGKVRTWLVSITRHHAIDVLRWQSSRPDAKSLLLEEDWISQRAVTDDPEGQAEASLQRDRIRAAVALLPDVQRQAVLLAYFRGYTHAQIAEVLRQPLGTIKTRIRLAMHNLRKMLEPGREKPADASTDVAPAYHYDEKEQGRPNEE